MRFVGICGAYALFLSVVGLVGTVAYSVGQRVREFGVRAAMGASPGDQARLVLGSALTMAVPGIAIGLFGTLLLSWPLGLGASTSTARSPTRWWPCFSSRLRLPPQRFLAAGPHTEPLVALRTD